MRKIILGVAAATLALPVVPAVASHNNDGYHGRTWTDSRGRTRCRKTNGTVGLLIGGAGGALVGRAIDTRGNRTTGTVVGAAAGALLGRHVARNRSVRHCR